MGTTGKRYGHYEFIILTIALSYCAHPFQYLLH